MNKTVIQPSVYNLLIQVNITTQIYNGTVEVTVHTTKNLTFFTLNAASNLLVNLVSIIGRNNVQIESQLFRYQPMDYVVIRFDRPQPAGQYVLKFNFSANLSDSGWSGLYLSNYIQNNQIKRIASTQFEFYDARKVFPCFDDPAFKSRFTIAIVHDKKMNVTLSNSDIVSIEPVAGISNWLLTKYHESPLMPVYLVALLISDFVCVTNVSNNVRYKVCATQNHEKHKLNYALDLAPRVLQHLEALTQISYPLNKVDLVAIPYFTHGAMENWGLITFRESLLLYSDSETTSHQKMNIAATIAHELAHFVSYFVDLCSHICKMFVHIFFSGLAIWSHVSGGIICG